MKSIKMNMKLVLRSVVIIAIPILLILAFSGCSTFEKSKLPHSITTEAYEAVLDKYTIHEQKYDGLVNTMDLFINFHSSEMAQAIVDRNSTLFMWDDGKYQNELVESQKNVFEHTEFFVSFYTPEKKHDNIYSNKTLWKLFLDVDGKRIEGKVSKVKLLTSEIQAIYTFHTRFASPYTLTFPISTREIENKPFSLTLTGPVGSLTARFNQQKN